jgi:hypothetical protein
MKHWKLPSKKELRQAEHRCSACMLAAGPHARNESPLANCRFPCFMRQREL